MVLFIFILSLMGSAFAAKPEARVSRSYDLNKDGKNDYTEVRINKILFEKIEDLDFDGVFDQRTTYLNDEEQEYFKVIELRKIGNNPKKKVSFWNDKKSKKTFSLTQIDKNDDGKWDLEYKSSSDIKQHRDECSEPSGMQEVMSLGQDISEITSASDEYQVTPWGHRVHKSCLDNGKKDWFLNNSKKAIEEGLSCLSNLGTAGGRGAAANHTSLSSMLEGRNVQVICNETGYDWGNGTIAHATTSTSRVDANSPLTHPGISVNPASISQYQGQGAAGENEFVRTIFHEQLHNLGYAHGHDIEYPYACETCCFPTSDNTLMQKNIACKVCSGNYNSSTDVAYLRDISKYGKEFYNSKNAISTNIAFLKENPASLTGMSYLAYNLSDVFNPIGHNLADIIKKSNELNPEEKEIIERSQYYKESALLKTYDPAAKIIAEAYYASYKTRDPKAALDLLKAKSTEIKAQLALQDSTENSEFVKQSMKDGLKKVIFDIWLNDYSGNITDNRIKEQLNMEAYQLSKDFGI